MFVKFRTVSLKREVSKIFLLTLSRSVQGPNQPPIQWVCEAPTLGVEQPGLEADYSPLSSVTVKNGGAIPPSLLKSYLNIGFISRITMTV
jgi:hypothetical protein